MLDGVDRQPPVLRTEVRTIGIDFDNTIVDYDDVFADCARTLGLVAGDFSGNKSQVRDAIRRLPDGNWKWTELQARVYGPDLMRAVPFTGFEKFLRRAKEASYQVVVISHKSRFAAADVGRFDLRIAALEWLLKRGLVGAGCLDADSIFFEGERTAKLARIAACGCTDFIDDLEDILWDPAFPAGVRRFHFIGSRGTATAGFRSWEDIGHAVFE